MEFESGKNLKMSTSYKIKNQESVHFIRFATGESIDWKRPGHRFYLLKEGIELH